MQGKNCVKDLILKVHDALKCLPIENSLRVDGFEVDKELSDLNVRQNKNANVNQRSVNSIAYLGALVVNLKQLNLT